jgi:5-methylcytosine-specific restriction endonuclease McrA
MTTPPHHVALSGGKDERAPRRRPRNRGNREDRRRRRFALWERQGGLCHWCGQTMILEWEGREEGRYPPRRGMTFDHIVKHADGGTYALTNLVGACLQCNHERE